MTISHISKGEAIAKRMTGLLALMYTDAPEAAKARAAFDTLGHEHDMRDFVVCLSSKKYVPSTVMPMLQKVRDERDSIKKESTELRAQIEELRRELEVAAHRIAEVEAEVQIERHARAASEMQVRALQDQIAAMPGAKPKKLTRAQWELLQSVLNGDEIGKRSLTAMMKRGHIDADGQLTDLGRELANGDEPPLPKARESIKEVRAERDNLRVEVTNLKVIRDRIDRVEADIKAAAADDDWEAGYVFAVQSMQDLRGFVHATVH